MDIITPSKKRKALAVYFDLIFFGLIWIWTSYLLFEGKGLNFFSYLVIFIIVEGIVLHFKYSPGYYVLSIYAVDPAETPNEIDQRSQQILTVDPVIKNTETWLTMILGVLFINGGIKQMERWIAGQPIMPMFGLDYESTAMFAVSVVYGAVGVLVGYLVLKLKKEAFWLGIIMTIILFVGAMLSQADWHLAIEAKEQWRVSQGATPRKMEDLESMTKIFKYVIFILPAVYISLFALIKKRLVN